MHDDISVMRLYQMEKCFQDGQIPCRWVPDMGFGYGYPQFNYYGPLPYYVQSIFHFFGLDLYSSVKLGFGLALILGNLAMFYLGRRFFGPWGGLIAATAYVYNPYRASDLYSRGAMGETWAFVFLPMILLTLTNLIEKTTRRRLAWFALSFAGLLVTHNISTLIFTPMAAIWGLALIFIHRRPFFPIVIKLLQGGLWAVAIAGFFFLPVVFEGQLAHTESLLSGYFNYLAHFVSIKQLFGTSFWGYGSSEIGFTDDLSFFLGPIHLILATVALILSLLRRSRLSLLIVISFIIILVSTFLCHEKSTFIWQSLPFLAYLQFPWRFLVVANLFISFLAGYIFLGLQKHISIHLSIALIFFFFLFNAAYFRPSLWFDQTYLEKFSANNWEKQQTVSIFDYLPIAAQFPPGFPAPTLPQTTSGSPVSILDFTSSSHRQAFSTKSINPARLQLSLFDWPTWRITLDGKTIKHTSTSPLALITIDLPPGDHFITAQLTNTPIRIAGNLLTLFSFPFALFALRSKDED